MNTSGTARRPDVVARRLRLVGVLFALVLVAALILAVVLGARAVGADPAWGDDGPAGQVVGGVDADGTRRDPARVGQGSLQWGTREGGQLTLRVDRAEAISRGAPDLRTGWDGPAPCQEYFLVEMTISYAGAGSWDPAERLTVLRMSGPFDTAEASAGLEILAAPLLVEGEALEDGDTRTGTVVFTGSSGTDWDQHLVLGMDGSGWLHVQPARAGGTTESSVSC